jgi:hypothetical protein
MNRDDVFKCLRLKSTFTVWRCVRNQIDALDFWGPNASKMQSCPCDQGIEIRQQMEGTMAARAICRNCDREMAIMQDGMCGGCFGRAKELEGSEKLIALAKARTDFMGKGPVSRGNRAPRIKSAAKPPRKAKVEGRFQKDPASGAIASGSEQLETGKVEGIAPGLDVSGSVSTRKPDRKEGRPGLGILPASDDYAAPPISIIINFHDPDMPLFAALEDLARKFRRNPDQQILWMIEQGIDYFNKNLRGEEVEHG